MQIGDTLEITAAVTEKDTALRLGSGGLAVLATPRLAALMEQAAYQLLQKSLPEGRSSVGIRLDIEHVSPTPVGMTVRVMAEVTEDRGKTVEFRVSAWDAAGMIGQGVHCRAVIGTERFMAKCRDKLADAGSAEQIKAAGPGAAG